MKKLLLIIACYLVTSLHAQNGDELLAYSMSGNVTIIENNVETKLKIGKVLKPGASLRIPANAKLTMVCREGKPISVTRAGLYPVSRWKDSCSGNAHSVSLTYFQYVWDQMYVRSEEYKKEHGETTAAVVRGQNPFGGEDPTDVYFDPTIDTVYYSSGYFPLSWNSVNASQVSYLFKLRSIKTGKTVFTVSIEGKQLSLDQLRKYMKPGNAYTWSVTTGKSTAVDGGVIKYVSPATVMKKVTQVQRAVDVPEDTAALYFRTAFQLENDHYLADAFSFYTRAAKAAPDVALFQERLAAFKLQYRFAGE